MQTEALSGGFSDPAVQSSYAFRSIMNAMARPGSIHDINGAAPPQPLSIAAGSVLLTLCDADTPVYLAGAFDCETVRTWLAFHTSAPCVGPTDCMFAVGTWDALLPMSQYAIGSSQYPDRSVTLITECPTLVQSGAVLKGPGIQDQISLNVPDVPSLQANHALFPLGLDFILTSASQVAAIARSTIVSDPKITETL